MEPLPLPLPEPLPEPIPDAHAPPFRTSPILRLLLFVFVCLLFTVAAFLVQRYRNGGVPSFIWESASVADGQCQASLPGSAEPIDVLNFTPLQTKADIRVSSSRFTRLRGGLGLLELDPERSKLVRSEDMLTNLRDEFGRWLGIPEVDKEGVVKSGTSDGMEVRYGKESTRFTVRFVAALEGNSPRVYIVWIGGPKFDPDGVTATRVLQSFRIGK